MLEKYQKEFGKPFSIIYFSSGVNLEILEKCNQSEHIKHYCIGLTVLLTALLATLSGGYALFTIFDNILLAISFGMLWGLVIYNIDRFIVSTFNKTGMFLYDIKLASVRIILAIIIAFCVSRPIELRLFEKEIYNYIIDKYSKQVADEERKYLSLISDLENKIAAKRKEISNFETGLAAYKKTRDEAANAYHAECDGTNGTGIKGDGNECKRKGEFYSKADDEYRDNKKQTDDSIKSVVKEIDNINKLIQENKYNWKIQRDNNIAYIDKKIYELKNKNAQISFLERHSALSDLSYSVKSINQINVFITLLFLVIEILPIASKLIIRKGHYDNIINLDNDKSDCEYEKETAKILNVLMDIENNKKINKESKEYELEQRISASKKFIDEKLKIEINYLTKLINNWKQKLENNPTINTDDLDESLNKFLNSIIQSQHVQKPVKNNKQHSNGKLLTALTVITIILTTTIIAIIPGNLEKGIKLAVMFIAIIEITLGIYNIYMHKASHSAYAEG